MLAAQAQVSALGGKKCLNQPEEGYHFRFRIPVKLPRNTPNCRPTCGEGLKLCQATPAKRAGGGVGVGRVWPGSGMLEPSLGWVGMAGIATTCEGFHQEPGPRFGVVATLRR